jgi:predicted nuclease of predicted toxin-antitoxin system
MLVSDNEFIIVTKDSDFSELSLLRGFPPKVIWIRIGNCTTNDIESLIRSHTKEIENFNNESSLGFLSNVTLVNTSRPESLRCIQFLFEVQCEKVQSM